jgi:hypothetical protein
MAQDFQTSTPLEALKRSNTGLLIGILAILVLCCVCNFPVDLLFLVGDLLIDFFRNVMSADRFALVSHLL